MTMLPLLFLLPIALARTLCSDTLEAAEAEIALLRSENSRLQQAFEECSAGLRVCRGQERRDQVSGGNVAAQDPMWYVASGDCRLVDDCLQSPNFPDAYSEHDSCLINITSSWSGVLILDIFETQPDEDILRVNGASNSGWLVQSTADHLHGVVPSGLIEWTTGSGRRRGTFSFYNEWYSVWKVCRTDAMPSWSVTAGPCNINRQGCFESLGEVTYKVVGTCFYDDPCTIDTGGDVTSLEVAQFVPVYDQLSGISLGGTDFVFDSWEALSSTGLQGALVVGEFGWSPGFCDRFTMCPQATQKLPGPWGDAMWTCTALGAPCTLPFSSNDISFDACTQQFSDLSDTDGDGNLHNGHPWCSTNLGDSLCGPCSCGPGEEQSVNISSIYSHTQPVTFISCRPCAAGKFKQLGYDEDPSACEVCAPGNSSSAGATACTACAAGHYAAESGCLACDAGSFSNISATACALCDVGTFQNLSSQSSCINCSAAFDPQALNAHLWTTMAKFEINGHVDWHEFDGSTSFTSCGCRADSWADLQGQCHECGEGIACRGRGGRTML